MKELMKPQKIVRKLTIPIQLAPVLKNFEECTT